MQKKPEALKMDTEKSGFVTYSQTQEFLKKYSYTICKKTDCF